jgi:putative chitinase
MITLQQLKDLFPYTNENTLSQYIEGINKTIDDYLINNPAMFLAQIGVESNGLRVMEENLNYSASRLRVVFPRYFHNRDANDYDRNPEKIANLIYSNRMGNGSEESGDGYKFRGRGALQITGKYNYEKFAQSVNMSVDDVIDYITTPEGAVMSAGWFWKANNINRISNDIVLTSRRINGGDNGLRARIGMYERARKIIY